jgi:hypothetical protein
LTVVIRLGDVIDRWRKAGFRPRYLGNDEPAVRPVRAMRLIAHLGDVDRLAKDDVIVMTGPNPDLGGYQLDVAVRKLAAAGCPAFVAGAQPGQRVSATALRLADRERTAIVGIDPDASVTDVLLEGARAITGGLEDLVTRAGLLLAALTDASIDDAAVEASLESLADVLGEAPQLVAGGPGVPLYLHDPESPVLSFRAAGDDLSHVVRELVLWRIAASATRQLIRNEHRESAAWSSKIETLAELVGTSDDAQLRRLARRARALGVPVDGHHIIVRLDLLNLWELGGDEGLAGFEVRTLIEDRVKQVLDVADGCWPIGRAGDVLLVLLSWIDSPGNSAAGRVTSTASRLLVELQALVPGLRARCGVSGVHHGLRGVGACLDEARLAVLQAAATETVNRPVRSDLLGLRPVMLEWFASSQVRGALAQVLEPLDAIGAPLRAKLLETLTVYLDTGCSAGRAAEQLGLHRNGLSYRLRQIEQVLGVDLSRPDERLALHLACRARSLFFSA